MQLFDCGLVPRRLLAGDEEIDAGGSSRRSSTSANFGNIVGRLGRDLGSVQGRVEGLFDRSLA